MDTATHTKSATPPLTDSPSTPNALPGAARAILRAFDSGIPFVKFGPAGRPVILARRNAGETIDDPDCEFLFEARETGIYIRLVQESRDHDTLVKRNPIWVFFCNTDHLAQLLSTWIHDWPAANIEIISMDCAWQAIQWKQAKDSQARREAFHAKYSPLQHDYSNPTVGHSTQPAR